MAGFTPLPYKLFTVTAGVFHEEVGFGTFVLASALSRSLRFYLTIWALHVFGRRVLERFSRQFLSDQFEPRPAIFVRQRLTPAHLIDIRLRMEMVAIKETSSDGPCEAFGDR